MICFTNHSNACNVLDSSRCMRYRHQQQRSSPQDANRTSYVRVHLLLQFTYVKVHLLLHFSYDYDEWTYKQRPNNAKSSTYISTNNNVKVHLYLHWSTSTTIALSSIHVHTINQVIIQLRVITTSSSFI